jgi:ribosomal protein L7/L12
MQIIRTISVQMDDGRTLPLSEAHLFALRVWLIEYEGSDRRSVTAIKYLRHAFPDLGLKQAKDITDLLSSNTEWARRAA